MSGSGDPDLLTIASSVPALIGQTFSVLSTHDAAILEFLPISFMCSSNHLELIGIQCADKIHMYLPEAFFIALLRIFPGIYFLNLIK